METITLVELKDHLQNFCHEGHSEDSVYIVHENKMYPITELDAVIKDNEFHKILISID